MKDKNESERVSLEELTAEFALLLKEQYIALVSVAGNYITLDFSDGRLFKISVEEV